MEPSPINISPVTDPKLVSIIVPVYNRPVMVEEAVRSALAQTYRPIEILIVDDESNDGKTPAVLAALAAKHPEVRVLARKNGGPGLARETGRQAARGEFIQYLDSDDLLLPHKLERQVAALNANPDAGIAYGMTRFIDADGNERQCTWKEPNQVQEKMFPSFLTARWWETATPLYRRAVTDAAGPWTEMRLEEDWEYDARVAALGKRLVFVAEFVVEHRDHPEDRLSRGHELDPVRLRDRARAHELIYRHARRAGVGDDVPEMKRFARELFLLARQSSAAGLAKESQTLLHLAREASGTQRNRLQFRVYETFARIVGWSLTGKLSVLSDRLRW